MRKYFRMISILLLIFNGISAMFGGIGLIDDPSGRQMQMPLEWLESTPFKDFLIPGYVLFSVNGLFNIAAAIIVILRKKYYEYFIIAAGLLLSGWLTVQILIIKMFYPPLHIPYYSIGIIMIICGIVIHRIKDGEVQS